MATKGLSRLVQPPQVVRGNVADSKSRSAWQRPSAVGVVDAADLRVDMLSCKICLGQYNTTDQRPRALVCQHTFCERCILECLAKPSRVKCPVCRSRTRFIDNQDGVHKLPINMTAVELAAQATPRAATVTWADQDSGFEIHHRVVAKASLRFHPPPNATHVELSEFGGSATSGTQRLGSDDVNQVPADRPDRQSLRSSDVRSSLRQTLNDDFPVGISNNVHLPAENRSDIGSNSPVQQPQLLIPSAVYAGRFGKYQADRHEQTSSNCSYRPGAFCNPTSIACSPPSQPVQRLPNRLAVTDRAISVVQIFTENGDYLSAFQMPDVVCACFVAAAGGADVDQCRLAVATLRAVFICDQLGRAEKTVPLTDVVAMATYRRGFVAACGNRLMMCDQLVPTVTMASVTSIVDRRPGTKTGLGTRYTFRRIIDVATSSGYDAVGKDKLYVLDVTAVYVVDASTLTLRGLVQLNESSVVTGQPRHPVSVEADPSSGHVIISDSDSKTVELFDPDNGRLTRCLIRIGFESGSSPASPTDLQGVVCGHVTIGLNRSTGGLDGRRGSLLHVLVGGPGLAEVRLYRI